MRTCSVISCSSRATKGGISCFSMPIKTEEANGWMQFLVAANSGTEWVPTKYLYVCEHHFRDCCLQKGSTKNHVVKGHYPSIIDGKAIFNPLSKCLPLSQDETLSKCSYDQFRSLISRANNKTKIQRDYLKKKLSNFSVPKIILGHPPLKIPPSTSELRDNDSVITPLQSKSTGNFVNKILDYSERKSPKVEPNNAFVPEIIMEPDFSIGESRKRKYAPFSSLKSRGVLQSENKRLRKSISKLEKKVEDISVELKTLHRHIFEAEERHTKELSEVQEMLKRHAIRCEKSKLLKCKCNVEVVDISEDEKS